MPLGEEIALERGHQSLPKNHPKNRYFTAFNSSSVRTVEDKQRLAFVVTSTADELSGGTNMDDLERR